MKMRFSKTDLEAINLEDRCATDLNRSENGHDRSLVLQHGQTPEFAVFPLNPIIMRLRNDWGDTPETLK